MEQNEREIRQANRKALPKFLLALVIACVGGGVLGFCAALFGAERLGEVLGQAGNAFCQTAAPWLLPVLAVVQPVLCVPMYLAAKRRLAGWDGEDETVSDQVDRRLSRIMLINSLALILSFFLTAAAYTAGGEDLRAGQGDVSFLAAIVGFVLVMAEAIILQQKLVDLSKRLYPEKQGSVYDIHFRKKWMESCDEAEKLLIGRCAFRAYSATNTTCLVLWIIFTLSALFFGTGVLPVLTVCIIWGVSQVAFSRNAMKRPGSGTATPL